SMMTPTGAKISKIEVIPVAGYDSMLFNLSGAHGPFFTRNIVKITDSDGFVGIGETPGGEAIKQALQSASDWLLGKPINQWRALLRESKERLSKLDSAGRGDQTWDLRTGIHAVTGLESSLLDIYGQ